METWRRAGHGQGPYGNCWMHHTRSGRRTSTVHLGAAHSQGRRHSTNARTRSAVPGPADRICSLARKSWRQSHQSHSAGARPATPFCKSNAPLKFTTRWYSDLSRGSSRVFTEDSMIQTILSAGQSRIGCKRARDIAALAAKPRIQEMIQDAVTAVLCRSNPWKLALPRSWKQPPPPTSAPLMTKIEPRQSCAFRRRRRQRKKRGSKQLEICRDLASHARQCQPSNTPAPPLRMKTARTWTSQRPGKADSVRRSSKRSFHGLIGLDSGV